MTNAVVVAFVVVVVVFVVFVVVVVVVAVVAVDRLLTIILRKTCQKVECQ